MLGFVVGAEAALVLSAHLCFVSPAAAVSIKPSLQLSLFCTAGTNQPLQPLTCDFFLKCRRFFGSPNRKPPVLFHGIHHAARTAAHAFCLMSKEVTPKHLLIQYRLPAPPNPTPSSFPTSCHRTFWATRAHTPCFGRHPGFKFIHEWRKRCAHRADKAKTKKTKTESNSECRGSRK